MTNDLLERFTFNDKPLRGEYLHLKTSTETILNQHPYSEPMKQLLAESLAIVSLLSGMIKLEGRISLHFQGKGKLKLLLAQCNSQHEIRGLIKHEEEGDRLSYDELLQALKEGLLVVMLEFDARPGNPYHGIVQWTGNSLTDAIEAYFENSEQLLTRIWLDYNPLQQTITGCMLQSLPNPTDHDLINLDFFRVAKDIHHYWQQRTDETRAEYFLQKACPHDEIQLFEPTTMQFKCTCSRAHSEQAIRLLGSSEAMDEAEQNGSIIVTCDFCMQKYEFDKVDVIAIFKDDLHNPSPDTLH